MCNSALPLSLAKSNKKLRDKKTWLNDIVVYEVLK